MFKFFIYTAAAAIVFGLLAGAWHLYRVASKNKREMVQYSGPSESVEKDFGRVLVVYYSLSGKTKQIAEKIREKTGADIYEIQTMETIKANPAFYLKIKQQIKNKEYPELKAQFPKIEEYDLVFVGSPVWWYTVSTPVQAFLQQVDFMNKKVVPFSTQGSNPGKFVEDFAAAARNAAIVSPNSFNNISSDYDAEVDNKISRWLNELK